MIFLWYKEINFSDDVTQGDIIVNCPIPLPNSSLYQAALAFKSEVSDPIDVKQADIIILSQACDIINNKIDSLVVCPVWTLKQLIESNEYYKGTKAKERLRQGNEPAYHLLNNYKSENINLDYSIVDFHRIYSLPKDYLKSFAININFRLRLLPPYREHLSQAFARFFMRVGLPLDIDKESIKNIN